MFYFHFLKLLTSYYVITIISCRVIIFRDYKYESKNPHGVSSPHGTLFRFQNRNFTVGTEKDAFKQKLFETYRRFLFRFNVAAGRARLSAHIGNNRIQPVPIPKCIKKSHVLSSQNLLYNSDFFKNNEKSLPFCEETLETTTKPTCMDVDAKHHEFDLLNLPKCSTTAKKIGESNGQATQPSILTTLSSSTKPPTAHLPNSPITGTTHKHISEPHATTVHKMPVTMKPGMQVHTTVVTPLKTISMTTTTHLHPHLSTKMTIDEFPIKKLQTPQILPVTDKQLINNTTIKNNSELPTTTTTHKVETVTSVNVSATTKSGAQEATTFLATTHKPGSSVGNQTSTGVTTKLIPGSTAVNATTQHITTPSVSSNAISTSPTIKPASATTKHHTETTLTTAMSTASPTTSTTISLSTTLKPPTSITHTPTTHLTTMPHSTSLPHTSMSIPNNTSLQSTSSPISQKSTETTHVLTTQTKLIVPTTSTTSQQSTLTTATHNVTTLTTKLNNTSGTLKTTTMSMKRADSKQTTNISNATTIPTAATSTLNGTTPHFTTESPSTYTMNHTDSTTQPTAIHSTHQSSTVQTTQITTTTVHPTSTYSNTASTLKLDMTTLVKDKADQTSQITTTTVHPSTESPSTHTMNHTDSTTQSTGVHSTHQSSTVQTTQMTTTTIHPTSTHSYTASTLKLNITTTVKDKTLSTIAKTAVTEKTLITSEATKPADNKNVTETGTSVINTSHAPTSLNTNQTVSSTLTTGPYVTTTTPTPDHTTVHVTGSTTKNLSSTISTILTTLNGTTKSLATEPTTKHHSSIIISTTTQHTTDHSSHATTPIKIQADNVSTTPSTSGSTAKFTETTTVTPMKRADNKLVTEKSNISSTHTIHTSSSLPAATSTTPVQLITTHSINASVASSSKTSMLTSITPPATTTLISTPDQSSSKMTSINTTLQHIPTTIATNTVSTSEQTTNLQSTTTEAMKGANSKHVTDSLNATLTHTNDTNSIPKSNAPPMVKVSSNSTRSTQSTNEPRTSTTSTVVYKINKTTNNLVSDNFFHSPTSNNAIPTTSYFSRKLSSMSSKFSTLPSPKAMVTGTSSSLITTSTGNPYSVSPVISPHKVQKNVNVLGIKGELEENATTSQNTSTMKSLISNTDSNSANKTILTTNTTSPTTRISISDVSMHSYLTTLIWKSPSTETPMNISSVSSRTNLPNIFGTSQISEMPITSLSTSSTIIHFGNQDEPMTTSSTGSWQRVVATETSIPTTINLYDETTTEEVSSRSMNYTDTYRIRNETSSTPKAATAVGNQFKWNLSSSFHMGKPVSEFKVVNKSKHISLQKQIGPLTTPRNVYNKTTTEEVSSMLMNNIGTYRVPSGASATPASIAAGNQLKFNFSSSFHVGKPASQFKVARNPKHIHASSQKQIGPVTKPKNVKDKTMQMNYIDPYRTPNGESANKPAKTIATGNRLKLNFSSSFHVGKPASQFKVARNPKHIHASLQKQVGPVTKPKNVKDKTMQMNYIDPYRTPNGESANKPAKTIATGNHLKLNFSSSFHVGKPASQFKVARNPKHIHASLQKQVGPAAVPKNDKTMQMNYIDPYRTPNGESGAKETKTKGTGNQVKLNVSGSLHVGKPSEYGVEMNSKPIHVSFQKQKSHRLKQGKKGKPKRKWKRLLLSSYKNRFHKFH